MSRERRTRVVRKPRKSAPVEPLLESDEIQGNILAGFSKDHQALIALEIRDLASARRWLGRVVRAISTTAEVSQFNQLFRLQRRRLGVDPRGLVATWMNLAFSHGGLTRLMSAAHADLVPDMPFRVGLPARAAALGDPVPAGGNDPTAGWVVGGTGHVPDIIMIVASDDPARLADVCNRLRPKAADGANPQP